MPNQGIVTRPADEGETAIATALQAAHITFGKSPGRNSACVAAILSYWRLEQKRAPSLVEGRHILGPRRGSAAYPYLA
jgi:hypothetical protein